MRGNTTGNNQYTKVETDDFRHIPDVPKNQRTTRYILGQEYGISENTIQENERFAKGLDVLPDRIKKGQDVGPLGLFG